jgi:hypothetical protein
MRAWGAAVSSGHVVLGLAGWLLLGIPPWFFGGCAVVTFGIALLAAPLMSPRGGGDDDGGGGGPGSGPDDPGPPWWPEFERDFRAYVAARERTPA